MSQIDDQMAALVARSNLVATAGEFVPREYRATQTGRNNGNERQNYDRPDSTNFNSHYRGPGASRKNQREYGPQESRSWRSGKRDESNRDQRQGNDTNSGNSRRHSGPWAEESSGQRSRRPRNQNDDRHYQQFTNSNFMPRADHANQREPHGSYDESNQVGRKSNYRGQRYQNQNGDRHSSQNSNGYLTREENVGDFSESKPRLEAFKNNVGSKNKARTEPGRNQMEVLITQLSRGTLECLVCCDPVKQHQPTWSCGVCHHVLHLRCVVKWARASRADEGWPCPACRHFNMVTPTEYRCFCSKTVDPSWNRSDCPHSCGSVCSQSRPPPCPHRCTLPCHPGPCPPCQLYVTRQCGCGRASRTVACIETDPVLCGVICSKRLDCEEHKCTQPCHADRCAPCTQLIKQVCFCGSSSHEVLCTKETFGKSMFSCGSTCGKQLPCENHACTLVCHEGPCPSCPLRPEAIECCPCGKSFLKDLDVSQRTSCLDEIPTCDDVCCKLLPCGEPGSRHECLSKCHQGLCPVCPKSTQVRCRCGHMSKTLQCSELLVRADDARCERKCNKRRSCGKHKCREPCCIDVDHICPLPCTRTLNCGLHKCEEPCHTGFCRPCPRDSFSELLCECGAQVIFPPVPCGTRKPKCDRPCSRAHSCTHPPTHSCHDQPDCPPCTVLVAKRCFGGHEMRKAVFCHLQSFSCGIPCGKPMPCGRHTCLLPCHEGACLREGQSCVQPCTTPRVGCGHNCGAPCHEPPCPDIPCKQMVKVSCECGLRYSTRACIDNAREYQRIATAQLASKMADLAAGQTVDLNQVASSGKKISFKTLDCTEECKIVERNRRMAVGLQIRNPDLSAKLTPRYSDFLRSWAKKDPHFCQNVHYKLTDLVQLAKESKQKSRSYSFESMNRDKRQFVHEYSDHFGCETVAYDQEPNRNIVATALRDKSWLPGLSLLEVIQRENGARKVPLPSNSKSKLLPSSRPMEVLPGKVSTASSSSSPWALPAAAAPSPAVDYFDYPGPSGRQPEVDYFDMAPL